MNFRKDINGLRAIAVMAVVGFHFGITQLSGGFVGVDIFFVISGFLMTGIIFRKVEEQRFSLWGFYIDRARRIIPALAVLCLALLAAGWFLLTPTSYETVGKHVASSMALYPTSSTGESLVISTWPPTRNGCYTRGRYR